MRESQETKECIVLLLKSYNRTKTVRHSCEMQLQGLHRCRLYCRLCCSAWWHARSHTRTQYKTKYRKIITGVVNYDRFIIIMTHTHTQTITRHIGRVCKYTLPKKNVVYNEVSCVWWLNLCNDAIQLWTDRTLFMRWNVEAGIVDFSFFYISYCPFVSNFPCLQKNTKDRQDNIKWNYYLANISNGKSHKRTPFSLAFKSIVNFAHWTCLWYTHQILLLIPIHKHDTEEREERNHLVRLLFCHRFGFDIGSSY